MSKVKVLGLAAGALLLFGVQQIAGAATAAAEDNPAEIRPPRAASIMRPITTTGAGAAISMEARVLSGIRAVARRGYYGASVTALTITRIAIIGPAMAQPADITERRVTSRYYAHRYYPPAPIVAD